MIKTLNQSQFIDEMTFDKDSSYANCFTYEGLIALYDNLLEYEDSTGKQIEIDPIALCCDYTEYESIDDVIAEHSNIKNIDDLRDNTTVIECDNGHLIIQEF